MEKILKKLETLERYNEINFNTARVGKEYFGEEFAESYKNYFEHMNEVIYRWKEEYNEIKRGSTPLFIGVVGTFNAGKSTFINSLLGDELLEIDSQPSTAKVTFIYYGERFSIIKVFKNNDVSEISYEEYKDQSNHREDSSKDKGSTEVDHFEIYYPAPILKNLIIADTPGFSSISSKDDEMTKYWMEKFDLLLWVFSPGKGDIDEQQLKILSSIKSKKVIGVLNKIDNIPPNRREKILQSIGDKYDFYRLLEYSAKKLLEENKVTVENRKKLHKYLSEVEKLFETNTQFSLTLYSEVLELQADQRKKVSEQIIPANNGYKEYFSFLVKEMEDLRRSLIEIKRNILESNISETLISEKEEWEGFKGFLSESIVKFNSESEKICKDFINNSKKINSYVDDNYKAYRKVLFDSIYNKVFKVKRVDEGMIFTDYVNYIELKNLSEKHLEELYELIFNSFKKHSNIILDNLKQFLNTYDFDLDSYEYELNMLRNTEEKLASSSINALISMLGLFNPIRAEQDPSVYREKLLNNIDYAISDEEHSSILSDVILNIMNRAYGSIHAYYHERIEACNYLIQYIEDQLK